ncbi:MAG: MMPL family transporter [Desulfobacterales bacterium]|jgi:predicted RND superfamily exporter protein|nr:MMPL family transporter [Desulfobacterales bacterium]
MTQKTISLDPDHSYKNDAPITERMLFARRPFLLCMFTVITLFLGYHSLQLKPEASFLRMIPTYHPYIKNYIAYQDDLKGLGNNIRIAVATTQKDIFSKEYMEVLKNITEEVFFISGVDRSALKSLWTPVTRWTEVTEEGFAGGPVIPATYDGGSKSLDQVRLNVLRSGEVGTLVANDFKSSVIIVPLNDVDPETGKPLDYQYFSEKLEEVRSRFASDEVKIHITGFAKIVGDLIEGSTRVLLFFVIAFIILLILLLWNSRCIKSTAMRAVSSTVAVVWQLGIMKLFGYGLNPYSMLVPFLMFALGVSHGIQLFNAMAHEMTRGADKLKAARLAYRKVFRPGMAALFTDFIGFGTLMMIRIGVIQDIAVGASIGVAVVAFTDLTLLPLLMSYSGISKKTIEMIKKKEAGTSHPIWSILSKFIEPKFASAAIMLAVIGLLAGVYMRQDLKIGDLDPGAPELRPDSRYNLDNAYMNGHYSTSSDIFIVMLKTPPAGNSLYPVVVATDKLKWRIEQLPGVRNVKSHVDYLKLLNSAYNEGNLKWTALPRSKIALDSMALKIPSSVVGETGDLTPIMIYLVDHKAETLDRVVKAVENFANENNTETYQFLMAAGNAGIEAATNIEVEEALMTLTLLVYGAVFLVCLITYRTLKGTLCVVVPLFLTSVLCEALMAKMGIGVKVATLPVIAVGVGIGVDYGVYIFNQLLFYRAQGHNLSTAYYLTLNTTGRAVSFTGITLAIGVATWAFSPIKFQADMGFLLTFMFLWNMVGAMVLLPALARYLIKDQTGLLVDGRLYRP